MSFFPLFAAATHVLRLNAIQYRCVQVKVHVEQTEVSADGVLASPTRTIFTRTSAPLYTERIAGFRCHATREWLPLLRHTHARANFDPASSSKKNGASAAPSWDVAMVTGCEGTMLVKETRSSSAADPYRTAGRQQQQQPQQRAPNSSSSSGPYTSEDIPITIRAQILGELDNGQTQVVAESGSIELSAARILFQRKVVGLLLHTPVGDVGVVVSVAREDMNGCQTRVEQFLLQHSAMPPANVAGVAENIIRAAQGDEIMAFCQLRKKFQTADFEGRLARFVQLYGLDAPDDWQLPDSKFCAQLLSDWAPCEELLFVALATMFGPEQDTLSAWIRFRAMNSVANMDEIPKDLQKRWRSTLRGLLSSASAAASSQQQQHRFAQGGGSGGNSDLQMAAVQGPIHEFFQRCCEEITACQSDTDALSNKFREPPPFLYLYDKEVRDMLRIDGFGGMSQAVQPGDLDGEEKSNDAAAAASGSAGDRIEVRRTRNSANQIVDVVSLGVQTRKNEGETVASQCNFFVKPEMFDVCVGYVEHKLLDDATVQTREGDFFREIPVQTDPAQPVPTSDAEVDATDKAPTRSFETQTPAPTEVSKRHIRTSTVGDLPEFGFVEDILAKEGGVRKELERALDAQMAARKRLEGQLARMDEAAETARMRLADEVKVRQELEQTLEAARAELADSALSLQRMTTQVRLADVERKDLAEKREETIRTIGTLEEQLVKVADEKADVHKQLLDALDREAALQEQLKAQRQDFESVKRQCDILAEDAKASRATVEDHFAQMKRLQDELMVEKTEHARAIESLETSKKHELVFGPSAAETMFERIRRLEVENEALLRERDLFVRSGAVQAAAIVAAQQATINSAAGEQPIDPLSGGGGDGIAAAASLAARDIVIDENEEAEIQDKVLSAKERIEQFRRKHDETVRARSAAAAAAAAAASQQQPKGDSPLPRLMRPRLPASGTAPILSVDDQYAHLTPSPGRHRAFRGDRGVNTPIGGGGIAEQQHFEFGLHSTSAASSSPPRYLQHSTATVLSSPPNRVGGAAAGAAASSASSPSRGQMPMPSGAALMTQMLGATSPAAAAAAGAAAADAFAAHAARNPRFLIDDGWAKHRRGLVDSARACWEQVASGAGVSTEQATQPAFVASRYEAEGLLAEMIHHDPGRAAELYSAAVRYYPNMSTLLRLAGLHDREPNGDKDVAVDLYKLAAGMGSAAAKQRLVEMHVIG